MQLVERSKHLLLATGSEWVLWLLVALSGASIAVIVERSLALRSLRVDEGDLRALLLGALRGGGFSRAREAIAGVEHPAARVALRGMMASEGETDPREAAGAMEAETMAEKRRLERRFAFLATLGSNAPFVGLLGTVIGILQAFEALGQAQSAPGGAFAPAQVMGAIAEALVATAVGLAVAIPAIVAFNAFQSRVKEALDDAHLLSLEVLAHLDGVRARAARPALRPVSSPTAAE